MRVTRWSGAGGYRRAGRLRDHRHRAPELRDHGVLRLVARRRARWRAQRGARWRPRARQASSLRAHILAARRGARRRLGQHEGRRRVAPLQPPIDVAAGDAGSGTNLRGAGGARSSDSSQSRRSVSAGAASCTRAPSRRRERPFPRDARHAVRLRGRRLGDRRGLALGIGVTLRGVAPGVVDLGLAILVRAGDVAEGVVHVRRRVHIEQAHGDHLDTEFRARRPPEPAPAGPPPDRRAAAGVDEVDGTGGHRLDQAAARERRQRVARPLGVPRRSVPDPTPGTGPPTWRSITFSSAVR